MKTLEMIECGEIYYIKGNKHESVGSEIWSGRPGIILSSEESVRNQGTINIIYLTSSDHDKAMSVALDPNDFEYKKNPYDCHTAICSQIHSVDKSRLGNYYGRLQDDELEKIKHMIIHQVLF